MSIGETGELSGRTLGQYEIGGLLGEGGMAAVYQARQASIGRTVAIKVMPSQTLRDRDFLARFEREVRVIADLQHPRVLPVYDFGYMENRPYIVMAYLSGGTLEDRIEQGTLSLSETVRLVQQMAEGLDFAHGKGIIHRDFKPANVLLDEQGNAHLADFGIARITQSTSKLTGSGIVGTPTYIAPEALSGGEITPAVDIYALGVTLYEMLTGVTPFSGETPMRLLTAHLYDPVPDIREVLPDLPEGVTAVIQRAMAKNPAHRYASAGKLAASLNDAAAGRSITPPPIAEIPQATLHLDTPTPSTQPLIRRAPASIWFGAGALALIAGTIGIMIALGAFKGAPTTARTPTGTSAAAQNTSEAPTLSTGSTSLPFAAANEDEVLVIVADFEQEAVSADTRIYQHLVRQVRTEQLEGVRIERLEGVKPLLPEDAAAIGEQYGATLVIWGVADSIGIQPHYEVVRNQDVIQADIELGSGAGDASSYSSYINESMGNEFEYLMLYILAQLAIANDQPEKAVGLLGEAMYIELGSAADALGQIDAMVLRCKTNRRLGNYERAVEDCNFALEVDASYRPALYHRGLAYSEMREDQAALADLNQVFGLDDVSPLIRLYGTGVSFRDTRHYKAALIYFEEAIRRDPENGAWYFHRGITYRMMGEMELALADVNHGLELAPTNSNRWDCYQERSMIHFYMGNYEAALADADSGIELQPDSAWSHNQRAYLLAATNGSLDQALQDINLALELAGTDAHIQAHVLLTRSYIYYRKGDYDASLADVDQALELVGEDWTDVALIDFSYAIAYDAKGNTAEAIKHYLLYFEHGTLAGSFEITAVAVERLTALGVDIPEIEAP